MKTNISIIRERGQLTIPETIRKLVAWANPSSAVSITVTKPNEIVIQPHNRAYDKEKIWKLIKKARSIKGKRGLSTQKFLEFDRQSN